MLQAKAGSATCSCIVMERQPQNLLSGGLACCSSCCRRGKGHCGGRIGCPRNRKRPILWSCSTATLFSCVSEVYLLREGWHPLLLLSSESAFLLENGKDGGCMCWVNVRMISFAVGKDKIHNREQLKEEKEQMRPRGKWFSNWPFLITTQFMTSGWRHLSTQKCWCF